MEAKIHGMDGKASGSVKLPQVFTTPYRPDVILRAVLAYRANRRQRYGTDPEAGNRSSAHYHGSRHLPSDQVMMNRELARLPREHGDSSRFFRARKVPQARGGRRAHPPKAERDWTQKVNQKERTLALKSAIAATINSDLVKERNHVFDGALPLVVEDSIQTMKKTKELLAFMEILGLGKEIERTKEKKVRAGKGKLRGRKYKSKVGPLIVVAEDKGISKAAGAIKGMDVVTINGLNAEVLSPGAHGARLTVWTKSAVEALNKRFG